MSSYRDRQGVWAVWDYGNEGGARVSSIHSDVVPAVREAESYQSILFWPFDMSLNDAIDWWKKPEVTPPPTPEEWEELDLLIRTSLISEGLGAAFGIQDGIIAGIAERLTNRIFETYLGEVAR